MENEVLPTEFMESNPTDTTVDYTNAITGIHEELVSLNDSIKFQNEFLTGVNDVYSMLFGVLIGSLIAFAILKGFLKNA